jgi:hypothetical protein
MRSEKPCNNSLCDVFSTCNEGKGVGDYRRTCHRYQRYLGQQEGQSERDALRAEVEVLRRALKWTARRADELAAYRPGDSCPLEPAERPDPCPENDECWQCLATRAISEARKGE